MMTTLEDAIKGLGWKEWPKEPPEVGSECEIFVPAHPEWGGQYTKFDVPEGEQEPYFFWCGNPKKVLWRYVITPDNDQTQKVIDGLLDIIRQKDEELEEARKRVHNFHRDYVHYEGGRVDKELNTLWRDLSHALKLTPETYVIEGEE
jgi:hypothetical protein